MVTDQLVTLDDYLSAGYRPADDYTYEWQPDDGPADPDHLYDPE
jgi:hypothetical protein